MDKLKAGIEKLVKDSQIDTNKMSEMAKKYGVLWYPDDMVFKTNNVDTMEALAKELGYTGASDSDFDDYSGYYKLDLRYLGDKYGR